MSLVIIGSVAFDAIETPFGKTDQIVGGSATYVAYAASNTVLIMDPFQRLPHAQKDMAAPRVLFALNAHASRVNAVQWISPNSLVSIGGDEKLIAIWRCEPGHEREPEMWKVY